MEPHTTVWIKAEVIDEINLESRHTVVEDPLEFERSDGIDEDPKCDPAVSETEFLEDPLKQEVPDVDITNVLEIKLEVDACDNEEGSKRCAPNGTWFIKTSDEAGSMQLEETCLQRGTDDTLEIAAEKSAHFVRDGFCSQDNELCATNIYSSKTNKFEEFICSLCMQRFLSKYNLIIHVFNHIDGVKPPAHICRWCGEVFPTNDSLNKHFMIHPWISQEEYQNSGMFNDICSLPSSEIICADKRPQGIDFGNKSLSGTNNVSLCKSDVNGKSLTQSSPLKNNAAIQTSRRSHSCDVCGKTFTLRSSMKKHSLIHTGERPHSCGFCGKSFARRSTLSKHILTHTGERRHKCTVCGKSFTTSGTLKIHAIKHTGERPYKCHVCGKSFTDPGVLNIHSSIHTGKRPHKCNYCGKCFTTCGDLKKHAILHTGLKPHTCDICGKSFTYSSNLKKHSLIHSGESPHICDICGKSFTTCTSLRNHALIHTGERPHKCDFCEKAFTSCADLKKHTHIHTGLKPYKCTICGKSFTQCSSLRSHELTHTGEKPHKCKECGKSFNQYRYLKRHESMHTR